MTPGKTRLNNAALSCLLFFSVFMSLSLYLSGRYLFGSLYFACAISLVSIFFRSQNSLDSGDKRVLATCTFLWLSIIVTLLTPGPAEASLLLFGFFPLALATIALIGLKYGTILTLGASLICIPVLTSNNSDLLIYQSLSFVLFLILLNVLFSYIRNLEHNLKQAKTTDPLTGCCSVSHFKKQFERTAELNRRYKSAATCLSLQIQGEVRGYRESEKRLLETAQICQSRVRQTDYICCYDNQHILILLPNTNLENAHNLGKDLLQACEAFEFTYPKNTEEASAVFNYQLSSYSDDDSWEHWFTQVTQPLSLR